jgi:hypothetical protein
MWCCRILAVQKNLEGECSTMKKPFAKQIIIGSMALTLLGGGVAIAISQNAFAATNTPAVTPTAAIAPQKGDHVFKKIREVGDQKSTFINDQLLTFLKLDQATFKTKLATQTLAQIAADQGISRDALKAELTSEFNAQLEKEKADFATNLDATVDSQQIGKLDGFEGGPNGKFHKEVNKLDLTSTATLLGYATAAELKTALTPGTSIADLATAKEISVQSVIDLQVAQIAKDLDQKLADKTITQAQYDTLKAESTNMATKIVNDKHDNQGGRGGHGPGNDNENDAEDTVPTTTPTTAPAATPTTAPAATPSVN